MSDLVGNPKDRFSHNEAHMYLDLCFIGETGGPAWKDDNKRISGNRYLNNLRREQTSLGLLG